MRTEQEIRQAIEDIRLFVDNNDHPDFCACSACAAMVSQVVALEWVCGKTQVGFEKFLKRFHEFALATKRLAAAKGGDQ